MEAVKKKKKRSKLRITLGILIVMFLSIFIIMSFYDFSVQVNRTMRNQVRETIESFSKQSVDMLDAQIERDMDFLRTMAAVIVETEMADTQDALLEYMRISVDEYTFDQLALVSMDGVALSQMGERTYVGDRNHIRNALRGEETISDVLVSRFMEVEIISLAVPLKRGNEVVAVMVGSYRTDTFSNVVNLESFGGAGLNLVVQSNGEIVFSPEKFSEAKKVQDIFTKDVLRYINSGDGESSKSFFNITLEDKIYYLHYTVMGINDWCMVSLVPEDVALLRGTDIHRYGLQLSIKLGIAFALVAAYGIYIQRRAAIIKKESSEAKQLDDARYDILLENLDAVLFDWDLEKNTLNCSRRWLIKFGYIPTLEKLRDGSIVAEEEELSLVGFIEMMREGNMGFAEEEYQVLRADGSAAWSSLRLASVKDKTGKTRRILGMVEDIDARKRREEFLTEEARRDSMTRLLNKRATEGSVRHLLEKELEEGCFHAIILADIDDFKDVNDTFGHATGDFVICSVADVLRNIFRESDIVGRIGGDEFLVVMRNVKSYQAVEERAKMILEGIGAITLEGKPVVTGSVGIAMVPEDGRDFESLYAHADKAMYTSKKKGKAQVTFYYSDEEMNDGKM